jgi:hypothetical protein
VKAYLELKQKERYKNNNTLWDLKE